MGILSGLYRGCGCTGIIALGLLLGGGQLLYTAVVNRSAVEMTCAEYLEKKPTGKWVKLKDCELSRVEEIMPTRFGKVTNDEVFIPVRPVGAPHDSKVSILLASKRPEDLEFARGADAANVDEKSAAAFVLENLAKAKERRDIEGIVRHGLDAASDKEIRKFKKTSSDLADDFVIIDDGKRPDWLQGLWLLIAGFFFVALRLFLEARRSAKQGPPSPPSPPPLPT